MAATPAPPDYTIVVPTIARPSLRVLLDALARGRGPRPREIIVVDDRPSAGEPLGASLPPAGAPVQVICSGHRGPAAARNAGWRRAATPWVAFLDDDVVPPAEWMAELADDLRDLGDDVAGSQGRIRVPLPRHRRPTDWERNVKNLESARWATADLAYRRSALVAVGGFDEQFRRAFREDADLGLRITGAGYRIVHGRRVVEHPVRPADRWISVRLQAGNADDARMAALHGRGWRERAAAGPARLGRHGVAVASGVVAAAALGARRPRMALGGAAVWVAATAEFAWARISPGPRDAPETVTMLVTSAAIPFAAVWHRGRGAMATRRPTQGPSAVLFDRDGTLVEDVAYNGDPARVRPVPGAAELLAELRHRGVRVGVVTNQSGLARGLLDAKQVDSVNRRIEELLGPIDTWQVCPHGPDDGCACRKPQPGLIERAAAALGVAPSDCVMIGDIGADVDAARAAGARGILVPTAVTAPGEVAGADEVAADLRGAIALAFGESGRR